MAGIILLSSTSLLFLMPSAISDAWILGSSSFNKYKIIKYSFNFDIITLKSVSSLKNVFDTSSTLAAAIENFWRKPTFGLLKPVCYKRSIYGQCKLLPYVYVYGFEHFSLNIVDLQEIREEMLCGNLFYITPFRLGIQELHFLYKVNHLNLEFPNQAKNIPMALQSVLIKGNCVFAKNLDF